MGCADVFHCFSVRISKWFESYGKLVGRHPLVFLVVPVVICAALTPGFFLLREDESSIEALYSPMNSRSRSDRDKVKFIFPDGTGTYYNSVNLNDHPLGAIAIFRSKNGTNVLSQGALQEMRDFLQLVTAWNSTDAEDGVITYDDVCGRLEGACQISGGLILSVPFWNALQNGSVRYPMWMTIWGPVDLSRWLAGENVTSGGQLQSATSLKMTFTLRQDSDDYTRKALKWEKAYISNIQKLGEDPLNTVDIAFSSSHSMGDELDKATKGDIVYFSLTFTLMITYASIVSSGGDCVSTRALLANGGVVAAGMGIIAAFGFMSYVGVKFVNICGVMPFLVLGIGVDDMFLLMSSWSGTMGDPNLDVVDRIGSTFRAAGIGITITSLTDFLAFAIGASSVFLSVRNFCLYSGVAVLFCYLCNATFFGACLVLHGHRVYSGRHTITCRKTRSRMEMKQAGENGCTILLCGGSKPTQNFADESVCEKAPRLCLPRFVLWYPTRICIIVLFAGYIALSIWGMLAKLEQGLNLKDLVLKSSYFHKFNTWDEQDFGVTFPVAFVVPQELDYTDTNTRTSFAHLMDSVRRDTDMSAVGGLCWYDDYYSSPYVNLTDKISFARALHKDFLPRNVRYMLDVVFDEKNETITASRCHVFSKMITETMRQAELMKRLRELADAATINVFAYQPAFVFFEQYVTILSSTLQTVGVTLAVVFFVTFFFLVHPTIVLLVFLNVIMIVVGIFGFMGFWGLTLSSVTMIHLIMSVGFSVDFSAHVCSAYMLAEGTTRKERAQYALVHASGPILNSGLSSLLGVVVLIFSNSFIFQSFFKIMLLVIVFGILHAVLLIPVLLSWLGPMPNECGKQSAAANTQPKASGSGMQVVETGQIITPGSGMQVIANGLPASESDANVITTEHKCSQYDLPVIVGNSGVPSVFCIPRPTVYPSTSPTQSENGASGTKKH